MQMRALTSAYYAQSAASAAVHERRHMLSPLSKDHKVIFFRTLTAFRQFFGINRLIHVQPSFYRDFFTLDENSYA